MIFFSQRQRLSWSFLAAGHPSRRNLSSSVISGLNFIQTGFLALKVILKPLAKILQILTFSVSARRLGEINAKSSEYHRKA